MLGSESSTPWTAIRYSQGITVKMNQDRQTTGGSRHSSSSSSSGHMSLYPADFCLSSKGGLRILLRSFLLLFWLQSTLNLIAQLIFYCHCPCHIIFQTLRSGLNSKDDMLLNKATLALGKNQSLVPHWPVVRSGLTYSRTSKWQIKEIVKPHCDLLPSQFISLVRKPYQKQTNTAATTTAASWPSGFDISFQQTLLFDLTFHITCRSVDWKG